MTGPVWSEFLLLNFKHARNRDLVKLFKDKLLEIAQHFVQTGDQEYVESMLKYLAETTDAPEETLAQFQEFVDHELSHDLGKQMGTLAQRLQEKGRIEGMDKMAKNIARKLLMQKSASVEDIAYTTDLPVSVVVAIQKDIQGKH